MKNVFFGGANALIFELSSLGLPGSPKSHRLFGRRRGKEAGGCFSAKKNGAKRTLPRRGGPEGDRTLDLCVANAALSQLSYKPES